MKDSNNPHPTTLFGAFCHMIIHGLLGLLLLFWLIVEYFHWSFQTFFAVVAIALLFQSFVGLVAMIMILRKDKLPFQNKKL